MCPTCCHWGRSTYNCPNPELQRCELCAGTHLKGNHHCAVTGYNKEIGRPCIRTTIKCTNSGGKHQASSHSCKHHRKAVAISRGNREEQRAREQAREVALQTDGTENNQFSDDLEEQGHTKDTKDTGETRNSDVDTYLQSTELQRISTDRGMEVIEDASLQVARMVPEPVL